MKKSFIAILAVTSIVAGAAVLGHQKAYASDHADTPAIAANPGTDLTDVYIFPSPSNANNVVLVMNVHPLIDPSTKNSTYLDPNVLYQFKIDNNLDGKEDRVVQVWATGTGPTQKISVAGPNIPPSVGVNNGKLAAYSTMGTFGSAFNPTANIQAYVGVREDPFFFDLEQFFTIFPDRATPINGVPVSDPNTPKALTWRTPGNAVDFLSNGNYDVISIVVEMPKTLLTN